WQSVLDSIRPKRGLTIRDADVHTYVEDFIKLMVEIAEKDLEDLSAGKPMLRKMEMLPKAVEVMEKFHFADAFVTYGGCRALAMWLRDLPNGEMPNVHLRSALLRCMERLPITKDALQNCDPPLGKVVVKLQQNPKETVGNRKLAAQLVQRWLRQVLTPKPEDRSLDSLIAGEEEERTGNITRPEEETDESLKLLEEDSAKRMHPTIPIIKGHEYVVRPVPTDQPVPRHKDSLESNRGKLAEVLKAMSRPNKKAYRPYSVSIAGRTLNAH
ncbi:unnamed protein product, partial [Polarella glacialis]